MEHSTTVHYLFVVYRTSCLAKQMSLLIWQPTLFLLLLPLNIVGADDSQEYPFKLFPSTVSVGSSLPPEGSTDNVGLASPNGMFNLLIHAWRDSPSLYCMAGVINVKINPGSMLWGANNAQPLMVSSTCRLFLSPQGDLLLQHDGNKTAWQTHTAGMGVSNLTLHNSGNLVLHTKEGLIVWQSFTQSPAFAWNSGMNLTSNITIYSSAAIVNGVTSFNVPGSFALQLHNHSNLVLFTNSHDSSSRFVYWSTSFTNPSPSRHANTERVSYVALAYDGFTFYDTSSQPLGSVPPTSHQPSNSSSALRVAVLDPSSANLLAFYRINHTWVLFYNSSLGTCENPTQCGNFGICNASTGACTCAPGFLQNASGDCEPETDISFPAPLCSSLTSGSVEASSYRFVSVNVSFPPQLLAISSHSVHNCTALCIGSCMCKVALFDPGMSSCSLFSNLRTLPSRADSKQLMLLKIVADPQSSKTHLAPVLGSICAAVAVSLCTVCTTVVICRGKQRRMRYSRATRAPATEEVFLQALPRLPPRYTYKELAEATEEFSRKLGAGSFGVVYEGVLSSGVKVVVKKLEAVSGQSSMQFRAEVASIGSVSHVNLVTLKGFCHEGDCRLLVYEHMGRGSLDRWLFKGGEEQGKQLGWQRRCKIAVDTARGLAYLHHECGERIVHCDVKPENILLDEEFNAKVGDFGLAKLVEQGRQSFTLTTVKGTRGYLAPEWLQYATISAKSDVYSFGIVLLELISGRRSIHSDYGYLPTLAFHIISMSSSRLADFNKLKEGHLEKMVPAHVAPSLSASYRFNRAQSLSLPASGASTDFAERREGVMGSKGSLCTDPREPIRRSQTSNAAQLQYARARGHDMPPQPVSSPHPSSQHDDGFHPLMSMADLLDQRLSADSDVSAASLERMIFIALWCVQPDPAARPRMSAVVQMMEGIIHVPLPPLQTPATVSDVASTSPSSSLDVESRALFTRSV